MSRPTVGDLIALGSGGYSLVSNVENFLAAQAVGNKIELTWKDPTDVIVDGVTVTSWAGTQIRRKTGNYPVNEKDGTLLIDSKTRNQYQNTAYVDSGLTEGVKYYYMAFPYTDKRVITVDSSNRVNATATLKLPQSAPPAPVVSDIGFDRATVTSVSGAEVGLNGSTWYNTPRTFTGLTELTGYTAYARMKETTTYYASPISSKAFTTIAEYTPDPTTWAGIQEIIRRGLTTDFFAVGDQITSTFGGSSMKWDIIGINHDIPTDKNYTNSMTLQAHDILESRAWHSSNANRYINSTGRAYLNDTSATGFIGKIDPALAAVIGAVDKQVTKNDSEGGGQDLFSDKVFHLSRVEVNLGTEGTTTGESVYAFYQGAAGADRIKTLSGTATIWWLRSPSVDSTGTARSVHTDGSLGGNYASRSRGFAPALVIY